jgi:Fe-S cluster assembly protein SufD
MNKGKIAEKAEAWLQQAGNARNASLQQRKQKAAEEFRKASFPTTKHEEWKYTNVAPLLDAELVYAHQGRVSAAEAQSFQVEGLAPVATLVFVNGMLNEALSAYQTLPAGLKVGNLSSATPEMIEAHFGKYAQDAESPFTAMSTAFAEHGAFVHLAKGKAIEQPVFLLYISDAREGAPIAQPRNLIVVEENAQLSVVERFVSLGNGGFTNAVTEISVAPYAIADHTRLQEEGAKHTHISTVQVNQAHDSVFHSNVVASGQGLVRNNLHIALNGQHCEAFMNGLSLLSEQAHADHHTLVDHREPNSYSNELYKNVLDGQSRGVFNGKIYVRQDAQKTNAFQANNTILLSDKASMDTKPQLEIWADDVKCSHGATIGALNEEPLFYLRARGIPEKQARALLTFAFIADVIGRIRNKAIQAHVEQIAASHLQYEF